MTTYYRNNSEGASSGTGITTANSDDNSAGDPLTLSTGGTRAYSNTWTHTGSTSFKVTGTSGVAALLGWQTAAGSKSGSFRTYFCISANPGATTGIIQFRSLGAGNSGGVQLASNGKLTVYQKGGSTLFTATTALSTSTTYRIELTVTAGTASNNGVMSFAYYAGDSTTAVQTYTTSTADFGTTNLEWWRWGVLDTIAFTTDVWFDDVALMDGGTSLLGPVVGDSTLAYTTSRKVTVDTAGSVGTMTLTQTSGTTATITGPSSGVFTITRPAGHSDLLTFLLTATGDGFPVSENIYVYPDNLSNELVFQGGTATDITNWA
jgi:hypothetical protein